MLKSTLKRRSERVVILLTPIEKLQLEQRAARAKQTVSGVIRKALATLPKARA